MTIKIENLPLNIAGGHSPSRFQSIGNKQLYNFCLSGGSLVPTPGFKKLIKPFFGGKEARDTFVSETLGGVVWVTDDNVNFIDEALNKQFIGKLETGSGDLFICENGTSQIGISDYKNVYIYDNNDKSFTIAKIPPGVTPGMLVSQDLYFMFNSFGTNKWYISGINDGKNYGALSNTNDNQIKSVTVGIAAFKSQIWLFGESLVDIYFNSGTSPFPYQKNSTQSFDYGCLSAKSISQGFKRLVWLGSNKEASPVILYTQGGEPEVISDENISNILDKLEYPKKCDSFMYQIEGHVYYQINFYKDNLSLLYDFFSGIFTVVTDENYNLFPIKKVIRFANRHYGISYKDTNAYLFGNDIFDQDGVCVPRKIIFDKIGAHTNYTQINKLMVNIAQGESFMRFYDGKKLDSGKVVLSISKDRGRIYNFKQVKSLADTGHRIRLLNFLALGAAYFWEIGLEFFSFGSVVVTEVIVNPQ